METEHSELTTDLNSEVGVETEETETTEETAAEKLEPRGKAAPITQERFDEIYGRMSRAERQLQGLTRPKESTTELGARPKEQDFKDYTDFIEKLTDYKAEQREHQRITETNKQYQERQKAEAQETFESNIAKAERKDPEFRDKAYLHPQIVPLVYDSERFAELGYYFKENSGETDRILSLPTQAHAAREIGRIEAKLSRPKPKTESNAPDKTRPVGSSAVVNKKPEDMKDDEYMTWRKKQLGYG